MMIRNGDILGSLGLWPMMEALASVLSAPFTPPSASNKTG